MQRSYNLIRELSKYHEVDLVTFNQKALLPTRKELDIAVSVFRTLCSDVSVLNIPSECRKYGKYILLLKSIFSKDPYSINWLKSKIMINTLRGKLSKNRYDLIFFDTISLVPYSSLFKNEKLILNHHNIESEMMLRRAYNTKNLLKKLYFYQEGKKLAIYEDRECPLFDLNITCSHVDSERILKRISSLKVDEVVNGVDVSFFYPLNKKKIKNSLIFVGGMSWYPNKEAMLYFSRQVWPLLSETIPDINMTVIGRSPPAELVNLADVDKRFKVTGFVDDVRPYIDSAMVYVCPITDGGGTKLKILDALAMGKAIVADPIACEGIDVKEGETVLFASTPVDYVEKIKLLFENEELNKKLGLNGRKLIEDKYSFINIGSKLAGLCENL
ncbi:MAG: glycosyltransferase [Candidatus Brocadiaceae bacterium]|nr:glycosyltransferase [Candidatus Brocadiaceae bacterium]